MDDPLPFLLHEEMDANDQIVAGYSPLLWLTNLLSNQARLLALGSKCSGENVNESEYLRARPLTQKRVCAHMSC